jgi:hypothetical protein
MIPLFQIDHGIREDIRDVTPGGWINTAITIRCALDVED